MRGKRKSVALCFAVILLVVLCVLVFIWVRSSSNNHTKDRTASKGKIASKEMVSKDGKALEEKSSKDGSSSKDGTASEDDSTSKKRSASAVVDAVKKGPIVALSVYVNGEEVKIEDTQAGEELQQIIEKNEKNIPKKAVEGISGGISINVYLQSQQDQREQKSQDKQQSQKDQLNKEDHQNRKDQKNQGKQHQENQKNQGDPYELHKVGPSVSGGLDKARLSITHGDEAAFILLSDDSNQEFEDIYHRLVDKAKNL